MRERSSTVDAVRRRPRSRAPRAPAPRRWDGGPPRRAAPRPPSAPARRPRSRARPSGRPRPSPAPRRRRVRSSTPSPRRRAASRSTSSGSSRGSTRSPCCSSGDRRAEAAEAPATSSTAIGPPPITTSDAGARSISHTRLARQVAGLREPFDRRHGGPRAGAEQDVLGLELLLADADRVRAGDRRGLPDAQLEAHRAEALGVVVGLGDRPLHGAHPLEHLARCRSAARPARSRARPRSACGGRAWRRRAAPSRARSPSTGSRRRRGRARRRRR